MKLERVNLLAPLSMGNISLAVIQGSRRKLLIFLKDELKHEE